MWSSTTRGQGAIHDIIIKGCKLQPGLERDGPRVEGYDHDTFLYDLFCDGNHRSITAIGPPALNLEHGDIRLNVKTTGESIAPSLVAENDVTLLYKFNYNVTEALVVTLSYGNNYMTPEFIVKQVQNYEYKLAAVTMIANENHNLIEWLEYHRLIGVQHFFIYDNYTEDKDALFAILQPYRDQGLVTLIDWPFKYGPIMQKRQSAFRYCQPGQATHSLHRFNNCEWLLLCDVDEFVFPVHANSLVPLLRRSSRYAVIQIESVWFGDIPEDSPYRNEKLNIKRYTYRNKATEGRNKKTKCIVRPGQVTLQKVHSPDLYSGYILSADPSELRVNHYYCVSNKRRTGLQYSQILDTSIFRFADRLPANMNHHD